MTLLRVEHLSKRFPAQRNLFGRPTAWLDAVDDVSFHIERGETLALVGESGSGKSTTGRLVLRLIEADEGTITFDGLDVRTLGREELRRSRRRMQMIFQDPFSSLDPHLPVGQSVAEPLLVHWGMGLRDRSERAAELLERVGLSRATIERYPSELSGGQLQRVAIARALTMEPDLIVCDEPVAALDVSVRAQVLNLMNDLQSDLGIAFLFISHDLALVEVVADRVAVMSNGRLVEQGAVADVYGNPNHDYTKALLAAVPSPVPPRLRADRAPAVPPDPRPRDREQPYKQEIP